MSNLNSLIETLVASIESDAQALRERYVLRQALLGLVRQGPGRAGGADPA